jgi:membrane protein
VLHVADHLSSLAILTILFAAVLRYLPDARLDWNDVWLGALLTAFLFGVGKGLLGWYLAWANPATAFGAAGTFALVLVWIYYSGMIFLLGAEFTQVHARLGGKVVVPEPGAVREKQLSRSEGQRPAWLARGQAQPLNSESA